MQGLRHRLQDSFTRFAAFFPQEVHQLNQVRRAQFQKHEAALDLFGNRSDRGTNDDELALVAATLVEVSQAASDLRRLAQRFVKILEVENGDPLLGGDEIQGAAGGVGAGLSFLAVSMHTLGQCPGPNGRWTGVGEPQRHFAQHVSDPLLFGGANVGERPAGFEHFPNYFCGAALERFGGLGIS